MQSLTRTHQSSAFVASSAAQKAPRPGRSQQTPSWGENRRKVIGNSSADTPPTSISTRASVCAPHFPNPLIVHPRTNAPPPPAPTTPQHPPQSSLLAARRKSTRSPTPPHARGHHVFRARERPRPAGSAKPGAPAVLLRRAARRHLPIARGRRRRALVHGDAPGASVPTAADAGLKPSRPSCYVSRIIAVPFLGPVSAAAEAAAAVPCPAGPAAQLAPPAAAAAATT